MKEGDEAMGKSSATKMKDDNVPRKLRDISIGRRIINNSEVYLKLLKTSSTYSLTKNNHYQKIEKF
jgi:hypothetical protein